MKRNRIFFKLTFLTLFGMGQIHAATTVSLHNENIELPFPKEWLAKGSEKKNSFVFFNSKEAPPRLMISLYASSFKHPRKNLSDFEQVLREKKAAWLKKVDAQAQGAPEVTSNEKNSSILLKLSFSAPQGKFEEWSHFEECSSTKGVVLKAMIPQAQLKAFKSSYESFFNSASLCQ